MNKIKFNLWWGHLRYLFQKYVLRRYPSRQPYFVANIFNPDKVFKKSILIGFQPNYFAFHDKGEIYNIRRLKYNYNNELWQEHVRVFPGEVRGHWEITYETDAVLHYKGSTVIHLPSEIQKEIIGCIGQS